MDSILTTIKKMLGIAEEDTSFDIDIIAHINSVLMVLSQLGVNGGKAFSITDDTETWNDYLGSATDVEAVKSYIYFRVRLAFDPPTSSAVMDAMTKTAQEYEWRLNVQVEQEDEAHE